MVYINVVAMSLMVISKDNFYCVSNLQSQKQLYQRTLSDHFRELRISDSGLGMICNMFPETLTRLLFALCPNITSSGIQFSTAQLPLLELIDCGMKICEENSDPELQTSPNSKAHLTYQKLFIKHARLKKPSLWGCSSLDVRSLKQS
ncbi:hypothetical protein Hanom_Chr14g01291031 [Helianthus anomalus]